MSMDLRDVKYDAFISYRHCELDQFVAVNLHKKLENFKLPKASAALLKEGVKGKIERVFRDEDELPLANNLSDPIGMALSNSEYLIVICTPRLCQSMWCQKEIETFMGLHGRERILLVLAEGEPNESFPEIMMYEEVKSVDESGNEVVTKIPKEPLAADVRGSNKKEMLKAMDIAVMKLCAAMFGLNYDDIRQRHREQKLKRMVAISSGIAAAVFAFLIVVLGMLVKINIQKNEIQDKYAGTMATASEDLLKRGRRMDALYALAGVLPEKGKVNSECYRMMVEALGVYFPEYYYRPETVLKIPSSVFDFGISSDATTAAVYGKNDVFYFFDADTAESLGSLQSKYTDNMLPFFGFDGNDGFVYSDDDSINYYSISEESVDDIIPGNGYVITSDKTDMVTIMVDNTIYGYRNRECQYEINMADYGVDMTSFYSKCCSYSYDAKQLTFSMTGYDSNTFVLMIEPESGNIDTAIYVPITGSSVVTGNDNYIYMVANMADGSLSRLVPIDAYTGDIYGSVELPLKFVDSICFCKDGLLIVGADSTIIVDDISLQTKATLSHNGVETGNFEVEGQTQMADNYGRIYVLGGDYEYGTDISLSNFTSVPEGQISQVKFSEDKYFYQYDDANYLTVYAKNSDAIGEKIPEDSYEPAIEYINGEDASEVIVNIDDIDQLYVQSSIFFSDKKHIAVMMYDGSIRIYDASNYKLKKVLYSIDNTLVMSVVNIPGEDLYALNANPYGYILDENFNCITRMDPIAGYEEGCFIVDRNSIYYRIEHERYTELLDKLKDTLGDYLPDEETFERYGMLK